MLARVGLVHEGSVYQIERENGQTLRAGIGAESIAVNTPRVGYVCRPIRRALDFLERGDRFPFPIFQNFEITLAQSRRVDT